MQWKQAREEQEREMFQIHHQYLIRQLQFPSSSYFSLATSAPYNEELD